MTVRSRAQSRSASMLSARVTDSGFVAFSSSTMIAEVTSTPRENAERRVEPGHHHLLDLGAVEAFGGGDEAVEVEELRIPLALAEMDGEDRRRSRRSVLCA